MRSDHLAKHARRHLAMRKGALLDTRSYPLCWLCTLGNTGGGGATTRPKNETVTFSGVCFSKKRNEDLWCQYWSLFVIAEYRGGNDCLQLSTNWCLSLWLHWKFLIKALFHTKECLTKECWETCLHRTVRSENSLLKTQNRVSRKSFSPLKSYSWFCQGCLLVCWETSGTFSCLARQGWFCSSSCSITLLISRHKRNSRAVWGGGVKLYI